MGVFILLGLAGAEEETVQDLHGQLDPRGDDLRIVHHPAQRGEVREAAHHGLVDHLAVRGLEGAVQRGHLVARAQQGVPDHRVAQDGSLGPLLRAKQAHELAVQVAQRLDV